MKIAGRTRKRSGHLKTGSETPGGRRRGREARSLRLALLWLCLTPCLLFFLAPAASATAGPSDDPAAVSPSVAPNFPLNLVDPTAESAASTVEIILLLTVLTLAPSILIMVTAFTRIVIVLSFTRNAMGTQQMPPNQVMIGLALFLTLMVMWPVITQIKTTAWDPYAAEEITSEEAMDRAVQPLRAFMFTQINTHNNQGDLRTFIEIARLDPPETEDQIPTHVLIPAFIISELKTAFQIGFMIFIPFIVIDMIVASALMSMGMMMLPPVMISLPFKIMLFVLVDGWNLTVQSLIRTFG